MVDTIRDWECGFQQENLGIFGKAHLPAPPVSARCYSEPFAVILNAEKDPFHFAQGKLHEVSWSFCELRLCSEFKL